MNASLKGKVKEAILSEICGLLDTHMDGIDEAMGAQLAENNPESVFKYPVSIGIKLEPYGCECKVTAKIGYTVKKSDESFGTMATDQIDMFKEEK